MSIATHGIAIYVGWSLWSGGRPAAPETLNRADPAGSEFRARSRDRAARAGAVSPAEVRNLLESVRPVPRHPAAEFRGWDDAQRKISTRIDSMQIPADFRQAFEGLAAEVEGDPKSFAERWPELCGIAYHWFCQDRDDLLAHLASPGGSRGMLTNALGTVSTEIYRRNGIGSALKLLSEVPAARASATHNLAAAVAAGRDGAAVAEAKSNLKDQTWIEFVLAVSSQWPEGDADRLLDLAVKLDAPRLLLRIQGSPESRAVLFARLLDDSSLSEGFRTFLRHSGEVRHAVIHDRGLPLDMRLGMSDPASLLRTDLHNIFQNQRDWPFAFRRGQATAGEVLAAVAAETPELAAREPELLRDLVFRELAEEGPAAAMELLEDLPEPERHEQALLVSRTHFENIEPDKFLELLKEVPSDTPEAWEGRLDAWNLRSFTNSNRLHEAYVEWVENLPPGIDREMALYSLARAVADVRLAARLQSQVTDPELKHRIETHQ